MEKGICILWLFIQSILDIRKRKISVFCTIVAVYLKIVINKVFYNENLEVILWEYAWAFIPGLILIGVSWVSENKIGMGDAIVVLALGIFERIRECLIICILAFLLTSAVGVIVKFRKRNKLIDENKEIPFIPFLLLGTVVVSFYQSMGFK